VRTFRGRGHYGFSDSNNEKIQNGYQFLKNNGNGLDVPLGIHDGMVSLAANRNVNLGIGTPKVDYRIVYQLKYAPATLSVHQSLVCYDICLHSIYEGMPSVA
jgi:hypothetical protein